MKAVEMIKALTSIVTVTAVMQGFVAPVHARLNVQAQCTPRYQMIALPDPSGRLGGQATGINNYGQVSGTSHSDPITPPRALFWPQQEFAIELDRDFSEATAINDNGDVVGKSITTMGGATLWGEQRVELAPLRRYDLTVARAISNSGMVVGESYGEDHAVDATLWVNGAPMRIVPSLFNSHANDINDRGEVVGNGSDSNSATRAFVRSADGRVTFLSGLNGNNIAEPMAINNASQVVGRATDSQGTYQPVLWMRGQANPVLIGSFLYGGIAKDINDQGHAVGTGYVSSGGQAVPFLYRDGQMFELNTLIEENHGYPLRAANAINRYGQIAGASDNGPVLLNPKSECGGL